MKTGSSFWFGYAIEQKERLKIIKDSGFDNVLLRWGQIKNDVFVDLESLPSMARMSGLYVENIHAPFEDTNLMWEDKIDTVDEINLYKDCIDACYRHNIPTVVAHLTFSFTPPAYSQLGIDNWKNVIDFAQQKGVNVALENDRNPHYLDYVFSNIVSDRLKFCYDSGHENCFGKGIDILAKHGDKLTNVHLHDNDSTNDAHHIIGDGNIDWLDVASRLKKHNFTGSLSLEAVSDFSEKYKNLSALEFLSAVREKAVEFGNLL